VTLPIPVKHELRDPISEHMVARMWTRLERGEARVRVSVAPRRVARVVVALAVAAGGVALAVGLTQRHEQRAASGDAVAGTVRLDDGSRIELAADAEIAPVTQVGDRVVVRQVRGVVGYHVAAGARPWTIETGAVSTEVMGGVIETRFTVGDDGRHVHVEVERGMLMVRGAAVPGGVVRLGEGMHVDVDEGGAATATGSATDTDTDTGSATVTGSDSATGSATATATDTGSRSGVGLGSGVGPGSGFPPARSRTWRELAAHGANTEAYARLGHGGVARVARTATVEDLFALADVARLSGHAGEAVDPLQRIVDQFAGDPRAPLAALTLGRIELRSLDAPDAAARAIALALRAVPADLLEDASALAIEAEARAGHLDAARAAYERFVARFPHSAKVRELSAWLPAR
jgi:transmembrane sensor